MKVRCAWCGRITGEKEGGKSEDVTDGICDDCLAKHFPNVYEKCKALSVSEKDRYERENSIQSA